MIIKINELKNNNIYKYQEDLVFEEDVLKRIDLIKKVNTLKASLELKVCHPFIVASLKLDGDLILLSSRSLKEVPYEFSVKIEEIMGNFDTFYNKNKNTLDILPLLWENIVSEVPIRVVKEGVRSQGINGEGWELISSD